MSEIDGKFWRSNALTLNEIQSQLFNLASLSSLSQNIGWMCHMNFRNHQDPEKVLT